MTVENVLSLLSGVSLFLFGMTLMGDGLKKVAGNKLEIILYKLSGTPLRGVLLGTGVTAIIQSSCATSVMAVGFVNSEMMSLSQAVSVILGSILGTSITGWVISLSYVEGAGAASLISTANITAIVAVIGIILAMFTKKRVSKQIGNILLGFAVLMFGMQTMSGSVAPLKNSPTFINMMVSFSNPFLAIIIGAVFTAILQSCSAAVGIVQALSVTGAVSFSLAYPMLLGISIGAAFPIIFSALGAKADGRRAAWSYFWVELISVIVFGVVFYAINAITPLPIMNRIENPFSIALVNTLYRLLSVVVLMPFIKQIIAFLNKIIKPQKTEIAATQEFERLEERFLQYPPVAVEQTKITALHMLDHVNKNLNDAINLIDNFSQEAYDEVVTEEEVVDMFEDKIGNYIMKITSGDLSEEQNDIVTEILHYMSDLERISDHALNLADCAAELHEKNIVFTEEAEQEMKILISAIREIFRLAGEGLKNEDVFSAIRVEPLEECIDNICDQMKINHIERIRKGKCTYEHSFVFTDLLTNYERISDHCSNLAIAAIELQSGVIGAHEYINNLKHTHSKEFAELCAEYDNKYMIKKIG